MRVIPKEINAAHLHDLCCSSMVGLSHAYQEQPASDPTYARHNNICRTLSVVDFKCPVWKVGFEECFSKAREIKFASNIQM